MRLLRSIASYAFLLVAMPTLAFAQSAGGNGILGPFITWFTGNFALGIVVVAILCGGVAIMAGVRNWLFFIGIAVGAVVLSNASTIASTIYSSGSN